MIELFDPKQDYVVRQAQLPHWFQPGVSYFVTFRTADSMPASRLRLWHAEAATTGCGGMASIRRDRIGRRGCE